MVTVILPGSYGKPRPAVIVPSKQLSPTDSTIVCPLTTTIREASFHRVDVLPSKANGLSEHSQIMVDKITALPSVRSVRGSVSWRAKQWSSWTRR
jgi:mRNA interferase MazF